MQNKKLTTVLGIITIILSIIFIYLCFNPISYINVYNSSIYGKTKNIGKIYDDVELEQKIVLTNDETDYLHIYYYNFGYSVESGTLDLELYANDKLINANRYDISKLSNSTTIMILTDSIKKSETPELLLKLKITDLKTEKGITFGGCNDLEDKVVYRNLTKDSRNEINIFDEVDEDTKEIDDTLYSIHYRMVGTRKNHIYNFIVLIGIWIMISILLFIHFKNKKDYKIKCFPIVVLLTFISSLICVFCYIGQEYVAYSRTIISSFFMLGFGLFSLIDLYVLNVIVWTKSLKIEKIFIILAIIFGSIYYGMIPQGQVPDEQFHFISTEKIARFDFSNVDIDADEYYNYKMKGYQDIFINIVKNKKEHKIKNYRVFGYPFLLYIPGVIGVLIGKIFSVNVFISYYLASLFSFIAFIMLGYFIVKRIPIGKYLMVIYLLSPMMLQQATSVSADMIINTSCLLFIAVSLDCFVKKQLKTIDIFELLVLSIFVFASKFAYIPLLILPFIFKDKLIDYFKKHKVLSIVLILLTLASMFGIFYLYKIYPTTIPSANSETDAMEFIVRPQDSYPSEAKWLLTHPFNILGVFLNTVIKYFDKYIMTFAGSDLAWLNLELPIYLIMIYYFAMFAIILNEKNTIKINKIYFNIIFILNVFVILGAFCLGEHTARDVVIGGVQGRYFIPFAILPLMTLIGKEPRLKINNLNLVLVSSLTIVHLVASYYILMFFL